MHHHFPDLTPLPAIEVNPLHDFNYNNEFSPVSSPDSVCSKDEQVDYTLTKVLPAFSTVFGEDCHSMSSRSEDLFVILDEESKSDSLSGMDGGRSGSRVSAPVWFPHVVFREAPSHATPTSVPVLQEAPASTTFLGTRAEKRRASGEEREEEPEVCVKKNVKRETGSRRVRCNMRERRRTQVVREAFSTLRESIPFLDKNVSKLKILRAATNYIEFLHEVYAASASELINGEVPKDTKLGVKYALSDFRQKTIRGLFYGNSEVLRCAFNMWTTDTALDELMLARQEQQMMGSSDTSESSPTTSSSKADQDTKRSFSFPATSTNQLDQQRRLAPWNWDY